MVELLQSLCVSVFSQQQQQQQQQQQPTKKLVQCFAKIDKKNSSIQFSPNNSSSPFKVDIPSLFFSGRWLAVLIPGIFQLMFWDLREVQMAG